MEFRVFVLYFAVLRVQPIQSRQCFERLMLRVKALGVVVIFSRGIFLRNYLLYNVEGLNQR